VALTVRSRAHSSHGIGLMNEFRTKSEYPMIPWEEAWGIVAGTVFPLPPRPVGLSGLLGLVLAEDVVASSDVPPFAASKMDGYAVIASDGTSGRRVLGEQRAGDVLASEVSSGTAMRIMTGAPLPAGADAVIPVEYTVETNGVMRCEKRVEPGENVRLPGRDVAIGDRVLEQGTVLGPAEVGLLATLGRPEASVYPRPRVTVIATGDELVPPDRPLEPGQIHDSNSYALLAAAEAAGGISRRLDRAIDDEASLRQALLSVVQDADVIITSGGVSMGTRDLLKPVLASLGTVLFGRVAIKPGKPLTFSIIEDTPVFSLPGFPVSSLVTFENMVRPALRLMAGHKAVWRPEVTARLTHVVRHAPDRMEFQRAVVTQRGETYWATTTGSQVSSRLKSLVGANALLRIPRGVGDVSKGDAIAALLINQPETEERQ
jgi:molybdopterin molybdotransferase